MGSDRTLLLVLGVVITLVGLGAAGFIGAEVVRLVRDLLAGPPERPGRRLAVSRQAESNPSGDTGPLRALDPDRFREQETVERLIEHFGGETDQ